MMKKVLFLTVMFLMFVIIGCPTDNKNDTNDIVYGDGSVGGYRPRGNGIGVKIEARGEKFNPSQSIRASRTLMTLDDIDIDTFAELTAFYNSLGAKKDAYTPTEFTLFIGDFWLYNSKNFYELTYNEHINFNDTVVFELTDRNIEHGFYHGIRFVPLYDKRVIGIANSEGIIIDYGRSDPSVTFTVPGGVGVGHRLENSIKWIGGNILFKELEWYHDLIVTGDTYKIAPTYLFPERSSSLTGRDWVNSGMFEYYFYSNYTKLISNKIENIEVEVDFTNIGGNKFFGTKLLGLPYPRQLHPSLYSDEISFLVRPFSGITIPENAAYVKFIVYMDLENVIERYEGDTPDTSDDIYIIANGFWNRIFLTAEIEY